jgi:hypothetical protein
MLELIVKLSYKQLNGRSKDKDQRRNGVVSAEHNEVDSDSREVGRPSHW